MASGTRTHSRHIDGSVSAPAKLYLLADHFGEIVRRSAPEAHPGLGWLSLHGVGQLMGPDILTQLTQEERDITPTILQLPFADGDYTITLAYRLMGSPVGFCVLIDGPDEVRVIGLAEKVGKDVERLVKQIESGDQLPSREPPTPMPAEASAKNASALTPFTGSAASPPVSQERTRVGLAKFVKHPYTIGTATSFLVWGITNFPAVGTAVSSWWAALIAQPWFGQGANIAVSVLVGIGSALVFNTFSRRRKK